MPGNFPLGVANGDLIVFNNVTQIWERGTGSSGGAPARAILPVYDNVSDPAAPFLTYKATAGDDAGTIFIQGQNLTGIVSVSAARDVKVGGNTGVAPTIGVLTVIDTRITVPVDAAACTANDYWGLILTDGDGNVYGAPSPLRIVTGA